LTAIELPQVRPAVRVPPLPRATRRAWERTYVAAAVLTDALAATIAGAAALAFSIATYGGPVTPYVVESMLLPLAWVAAIAAAGGYDRQFLGNGPDEFRRVALGALGLFAFIGFLSWALEANVARGYVVVALPTAGVLTWLNRYALRKWVHGRRRHGDFVHRTIVVGPAPGIADLSTSLAAGKHHGYQLLGACVTAPTEVDAAGGLPVVGSIDTIAEVVARLDVDTVAVVSSPEMSGEALRRLSWDLEPTGANLVVAPGLIEVAGARMAVRPVEGLPLLHVEHPRFSGLRRLIKSVYDPVAAGAALLLLSPILLGIALIIKMDSPGPALFRQARVGQLGREFTILKFRTMSADADQRKHEIAHLNDGSSHLFKARNDPRVTRVGGFLRRTSLDELPQLLNVLVGDMSLVGPRPHLQEEVALFGEEFSRRLFVKPGLTGLWQISGRSDLSFEESVRLDLRYVENWTLTWDLFIMWKTLSVMVKRTGAY
jgi:exopolysaccharide biosynthesis polyprenyl glycosylphosphotransferase